MTLDDTELWKEVPGFPDYAVSNYGFVVNLHTDRLLKPRDQGRGYYRVSLRRNNLTYEVYVHHIVAECFFPGFKPGLYIGHVNDDKSNNSIWNLKLFVRDDTERPKRHRNKVWGQKVRIIETGEVFRTVYDCAEYIGGNASCIYKCLRGERRTHLGYSFEGWGD